MIGEGFENQIGILPYKKKKGKELTGLQKERYRIQSKITIRVEHAIAQIREFGINSDVFGNRFCRCDVINEIVCGIVNFKLEWKQEFVVIP